LFVGVFQFVVVMKFDVRVIRNQHPVNVEVLQDENSSHVGFEALAELFVPDDGTRDRLQWELYQAGKYAVY
jgi:hypothetical protein